ncbi:MAG: lysophospholipid acyltransferase family protein [Pseudomonadota bacterium]|uniref:Lysophospholipid acyltransferase family protein n=1 Tax=Candidatus Desulfatibia profunda TaxID=2841695 RepID=A0A8J6TNM4_9BACT|nr:lysophospholipid acyltransferase family protein [Candidatus Desulfatibia profunda]MBL7178656.1 lysophospholipid acyltransferase family protein [Desulfobacterales bacterium]
MKINLSSFLQCRFNIFLCRLLGWRITLYYISFLGRLYFFFNGAETSKIKTAVQTAFGGCKQHHEIKSITKDIFRGILYHYYEKIFNAFSAAKILRAFINTHIEGAGLDAVRQGLARGKGVLLITGHYGGVEFIPAFLGANNYPVTIVAKFKSKRLRQVSLQQAEHFNVKIIDADFEPNIVKTICKDLKENRIVITQCDEIDEWKPSRHNRILFLGKPISLDRTIDILSKRWPAAVVFGVMHRNDQQRYSFIATSLVQIAKQLRQHADRSVGAVVLKLLEECIYKYPQEWYLWKKYPELDMFTPADIKFKAPSAIGLLQPSIG